MFLQSCKRTWNNLPSASRASVSIFPFSCLWNNNRIREVCKNCDSQRRPCVSLQNIFWTFHGDVIGPSVRRWIPQRCTLCWVAHFTISARNPLSSKHLVVSRTEIPILVVFSEHCRRTWSGLTLQVRKDLSPFTALLLQCHFSQWFWTYASLPLRARSATGIGCVRGAEWI